MSISFGSRLREFRQKAGRTQLELAHELSVQRATVTQWESGKHLPSDAKVVELDRRFDAGGVLIRLAGTDRSTDKTGLSIREVFDHVGETLSSHLLVDESGHQGWAHDLLDTMRSVRPLSTAYGIKALVLIDGPYVDLHALSNSLLALRTNGGWGVGHGRPRPESTAAILDALTRVGASLNIDEEIRLLATLFDEAADRRVHIVATVLEMLARVRPESDLARRLVDRLLKIRQTTARVEVWPERGPNSERLAAGLRPEPSIPHTARAIIALHPFRHRPDVADALDFAFEWLSTTDHGSSSRENLHYMDGASRRDLEIRHFTPALVARALSLGSSDHQFRLQSTLDDVWRRYQTTLGAWSWSNGETPLWLQHEAVAAVRAVTERQITSRVSPIADTEPGSSG